MVLPSTFPWHTVFDPDIGIGKISNISMNVGICISMEIKSGISIGMSVSVHHYQSNNVVKTTTQQNNEWKTKTKQLVLTQLKLT